MNPKSFENLTIVSVTGASSYVQGAIYAIARSCAELKGAKGLLICPALPEGVVLPENIEHKQIAPMGYIEYNIFMLYQLDFYIQTDYCLIVQNDGWVLNGKNWRDEFWDYDYIGAPVPMFAYYNAQNQLTLITGDDYLKNLSLMNDPAYINPQNGGFCLRSKKLLGMPRQLNLNYIVSPPLPPETTLSPRINLSSILYYEDIFLTVLHRNTLMQHGIRFSPNHIALDFAVESLTLHRLCQRSLNDVLGGHFTSKIQLIDTNKITLSVYGEDALKSDEERRASDPRIDWFISMGYELTINLHKPRTQ